MCLGFSSDIRGEETQDSGLQRSLERSRRIFSCPEEVNGAFLFIIVSRVKRRNFVVLKNSPPNFPSPDISFVLMFLRGPHTLGGPIVLW